MRAEEADQGVEPDVEEEAEDGEGSFLLKFVQEVEPQVMDQFTAQASPEIVDAMKQTISNMLGNLPSKYFDVTIKTVGENLAQLMLSVIDDGIHVSQRPVQDGRDEDARAAVAQRRG